MFEPEVYKKLFQGSVILASTSERRKQILSENLGIPLDKIRIEAPNVEENIPKSGKTPLEYVQLTARLKGDAVSERVVVNRYRDGYSDRCVVICADTVISCDGWLFEKPKDADCQRVMLDMYRDVGEVEVISAVCVYEINGGRRFVHEGVEVTKLKFNRSVSDDFVDQYIKSGEGADVAGGFKYQGLGSMLFYGMKGDFYNVVGLPVNLTLKLIMKTDL